MGDRKKKEHKELHGNFNIIEALEIAEIIEEEGTRYYQRAAGLFDDPSVRETFKKLAKWETTHQAVFAKLKEQARARGLTCNEFYIDAEKPDPEEAAMGAVFAPGMAARELRPDMDRTAVLRHALKKEKRSIRFYEQLREHVPAECGRDLVDQVIKEEFKHIEILQQSLNQRKI